MFFQGKIAKGKKFKRKTLELKREKGKGEGVKGGKGEQGEI